MRLLGGTNVQASAPEVRDVLARHVADGVTFPWGSIVLFGIDKVTKYHLEMPFYTTTFALVFNKAKYDAMDAKQKKVIDDHCNSQWALKIAAPWADFEHNGIAKIKAEPGQNVYTPTKAQVANVRKAAAPLTAKWDAQAKKAGVDPRPAQRTESGPEERGRGLLMGRLLASPISARPRASGDPVRKSWIPACAGMSGVWGDANGAD